FFFSSRRRHTRFSRDWSSDVCSSDLELNSDWTASQELADVLMRKYRLPFREGHHFASEVVSHARAQGIKPLDFPYAEAQRIYARSEERRVGEEGRSRGCTCAGNNKGA